jgi:anion-transporting  ArsA/GET3 family ATPase
MLTFLSAPMGLSDALRVGPVRRQSDWLLSMLQDPERTRVHLVTLAEEMPVSETLETAEALRTKVGIAAGPVFANAVYSKLFTKAEGAALSSVDRDSLVAEAKGVGLDLDEDDLEALIGYAQFLEARRAIQNSHLKQLRKGIEEPIIELPFLFSAGLALPDIETLADRVENEIESL